MGFVRKVGSDDSGYPLIVSRVIEKVGVAALTEEKRYVGTTSKDSIRSTIGNLIDFAFIFNMVYHLS